MTVFQSDRASADLTDVEEGALKGLASLGYNPPVEDLCSFAAGYVYGLDDKTVTEVEMRAALLSLDALGWAVPESGEPLTSERWYVSWQGRIALEGVKS